MNTQDPFSLFYKKYKNRIFSYLLKRTGDYHHAMDITQEAFTRYFSRYRDQKDSQGLLYVIARHAAVDSFRKKKEDAVLSNEAGASQTRTPEQQVAEKQKIEQIRRAISQLDPTDQELIRMVSLERLTYREIGKRLDYSEGNIKVKVYRARLRLKHILEKEG